METLNAHQVWLRNGKDETTFFKNVQVNGRDNARSPIQWSASPNGGFSRNTPWIGSNSNFNRINVANQENDIDSILNFYRKAIQIRKGNSTLVYGDFEVIDPSHPSVFAYRRTDENGAFLVMINFSEEEIVFEAEVASKTRVVLANYPDSSLGSTASKLRAWEAMLVEILP